MVLQATDCKYDISMKTGIISGGYLQRPPLCMGERRLDNRLITEVFKHLQTRQNVVLSGLAGSGKAYFLQQLVKVAAGKCLCLVPGEEKAYDLRGQLRVFTTDDHIHLFLGRDFVFLKENYSQAEGSRVSLSHAPQWFYNLYPRIFYALHDAAPTDDEQDHQNKPDPGLFPRSAAERAGRHRLPPGGRCEPTRRFLGQGRNC